MAKPKKILLLERVLRMMARAVLRRHHPQIVGITGSIGKTSAKEAIYAVLASHYRVRKNEKNYNNEIGLPLTIIGAESGNRSLWKWLKVFFKWCLVVLLPVRYPEILVLEMGVDRSGDMDYLLSFIRPEVGVVTNISSSHLEFFRNIENIAREKGKLIKALPARGLAVLNNDDDLVLGMKEATDAESLTFGFGEFAEVSATKTNYVYEGDFPQGITFKLSYGGSVLPIRLPHVIAPHLIYAALAAVAAGIYFKLNLVEIAGALKNFSAPHGRMNLIPGIKDSYLIDDSYNSSPASSLAAIQVLSDIKAQRKIVVLGDMLELGIDSEKGHREVADRVYEMKADYFLAVGDRISQGARVSRPEGYPKRSTLFFGDPQSAGKALQQLMRPGDLVLIKGSQGMRMEKVTEEVMREPQKAAALLVRQTTDWRRRPYQKP